MLEFRKKAEHLLQSGGGIPFSLGNLYLLLMSSTYWMRPTDIIEGILLYYIFVAQVVVELGAVIIFAYW